MVWGRCISRLGIAESGAYLVGTLMNSSRMCFVLLLLLGLRYRRRR